MLETAIIFAAGRGERLLPLTAHTPKPMLKIKNKPLLAYHLEKLSAEGFKRVIINHAYLGQQIKTYFGSGQGFNFHLDYFSEPPGGLETGGTLAAILHHMQIQDSWLLTLNADVFCDYPLNRDKMLPQANKNGHLIIVPPPKNIPYTLDFGCDEQGQLSLESKAYIFSGIACYRTKALSNLQIGRYSIRHWLFNQIQENKLSGTIYPGLWLDIGDPIRYQLAQSLIDAPQGK
jgi:MurNAc alpha-1-phosphate uridylyltransferase